MSLTLNHQDKLTLRTAAYGAVTLLSAAGAAGGSPHRIATDGSIALASATGPVGHVLAEKSTAVKLKGSSVAAIADQVLPALTEAMSLLKKQDPAEADNFRGTVLVAVEAATRKDGVSPTVADMIRKITAALDAA
ncbi:hypothetical protein [Catellatospora coxensis]|uniref:Uncharacterized protein n=1 Tax=Catellatospora coxensis TaxID=310354 RepID=A0A8J3KMH9_9ACTN|nr:hypothetical protein [Catellatospora coxensis]GIG03740.1 hypothetical protein Cco03nite_04400 [Catellatospora coxensis]